MSGTEDKRQYYDKRWFHDSHCSGNSKDHGCWNPGTIKESNIRAEMLTLQNTLQ